jgi:zinc/manganese transport system permease protein
MLDVLTFLAAPFAACLILVGLLGYFGLHVLLREVIFVDLALAQVAALGTVVALAAGHEVGSRAALLYSLTATVLGAVLFTFTRRRRGAVVPQEAIIGITYVIATAAAILVADRAPEGAEHIKELLAGTILWVTWPVVLRDLAIFAGVGLFHWLFRRRFVQISERAEEAVAQGVRVHLWDFLFYLSFGVVITLAVTTGGVLMVFAYLVAPAILALSNSRRWGVRMLIAWAAGFGASALGLLSSYWWDLPSGPAIVCSLGLFLMMFAAWRALVRREAGAAARRSPREETSTV